MSKIIVGLFGVSLCSINYGVTALGISQIHMLETIARENDLDLEYWIFSDEEQEKVHLLKDYLPLEKIQAKYIIRIKTGIKGLKRMQDDIQKCSLIIDLTYGDSFSDIYGLKNYYLYRTPKVLTLRTDVPLVLGPQTYGPFSSRIAERAAFDVLKKAQCVYTRDRLSLDYCHEHGIADVKLSSDLAMELPYKKQIVLSRRKTRKIGINVSVLLWEKSNDYGFRLDYPKYIETLLSQLSTEDNEIHLITHVYDSEYDLAGKLARRYKNVICAPPFPTPVAAKEYISKMDLFIGSRMHATIAAFSSGTPVIPVSYSRKFEGLYGTLGYPYLIDCTKLSLDEALDMTGYYIRNIEDLREKEKSI